MPLKTCQSFYEDQGYVVKSVEKDNVGWDLEAVSGKETLKIEVKGLSGDVFSVGLTPNEYRAFKRCQKNYRLVVVLKALEDPQMKICRYSEGDNVWLVEGGDLAVRVKPIESAFISAE